VSVGWKGLRAPRADSRSGRRSVHGPNSGVQAPINAPTPAPTAPCQPPPTSSGRSVSSSAASSFSTSSSRAALMGSFSFFSASRSTRSRTPWRSSESMDSGLESSCTRTVEHASSTRSMALSGRKRVVM
jgi:hypothetical protein